MKAQNNPGNGYFAVLPNNEETAQVLAYLRKHLSPDRKITARGQGTPTNGKRHRDYPYGLPKSAASHIRLYLTRDDSTAKYCGISAQGWFERWREENVKKQGFLSQLVNLKHDMKELIK